MLNSVRISDLSSNLLFEFQTIPNSSIKNSLSDYLLRPDPEISTDTRWILKNYQQNNEYVRMLINHLENNGFNIIFGPDIKNKIYNIISYQELKKIQEKGKSIKETHEYESINIPGFKRILKNYQIMPVKHHIDLLNVSNFSVPGSGKTTMVLAGYSLLKSKGIVNKLLVIGPYSSLMPWEDEMVECFFDPPQSIRIHGSIDKRLAIFYEYHKKYEVFLTTYHTAVNDIKYLSKLISNDNFMVVLDESHYIKNIDGKMANILLTINQLPKSKIILTGTPVPNNYTDIFTQFSFLYPSTLLGNASSFKTKAKNEYRMERFLKRELSPLFTRITKKQMELPGFKEKRITVPMSSTQTLLYRAVAEAYEKIINEMTILRFDIINDYKRCKAIRLRQIASNLVLLTKKSREYDIESFQDEILEYEDFSGGQIQKILNEIPYHSIEENSPKIFEVIKLVKKLKEKEVRKIIIWSDFVKNLKTIENLLKNEFKSEDTVINKIFGETKKAKDEDIKTDSIDEETREGIIRKFKSTGKFAILIMNPMACAESISLHKSCHHAIYLDRSYNCGQFMQSKDRIHRIGLNPNIETYYYYLLSEYESEGTKHKSIDHQIDERLEKKEHRMLDLLNDPSKLYFGKEDEEPLEELDYDFEEDFDESAFDD